MRWRPFNWLLLGVMLLAMTAWFWRVKNERAARTQAALHSSASPLHHFTLPPASQILNLPGTRPVAAPSVTAELTNTSLLTYRLTNTDQTAGQLARNERAILLENALIETSGKVELPIPEHLRAHGEPGAYIVQARGPVDNAFRAALRDAGARIVSYIPNNAFLVQMTSAEAGQLQGVAQAVLPYEPYYKLKPGLLGVAVKELPLPEGINLRLLLFADGKEATEQAIKDLGASVAGEERSPFGPIVQVTLPARSLVALAGLPGVQEIELARSRVPANDLSRAALGVASDSIISSNYQGLSGTNTSININDTGVDTNHPDLQGRVSYDFPTSGVDSNGHGTFVAGIIAGSGLMSTNVTNASGSIMPATTNQFRGKAPAAQLFSMSGGSDAYLQETAAGQTNVLISNNSWTYGANTYDLAAASYDAAVRDALPMQSGSRALLYVFPSGNGGAVNLWDTWGNDAGTGGTADTVQSPGTAKNVITVGAIEQPRYITNLVAQTYMTDSNTVATNYTEEWMPTTDSGGQVAGFSSRGNVGIGTEGDFGRFKPDVVAPGTFIVSDRSTEWDETSYYSPTSHIYYSIAYPDSGVVLTNKQLWVNQDYVPDNAVGFNIYVLANALSPSPLPDQVIYVRQDAYPTNPPFYCIVTNTAAMPPDGGATLAPIGTDWYFAISNTSSDTVHFDVLVDIVVTNTYGDFFQALSNMNDALCSGPPFYYRYESGTSLAAAEASGVLALMEEMLESRVQPLFSQTNKPSPALMKAMLINGARSLNGYSIPVNPSINYQGWGLINLSNSVPVGLTNLTSSSSSSMLLAEQNPTNALATGQSQTRFVKVSTLGERSPLRVTLVWTDPPGNPVAGVKLVNDLNLVVTNLDKGWVYWGNDIPTGSTYNRVWNTNNAANVDVVNNVENVFIQPVLGSNYSITVIGSRVNVNAVTAQTNDVVQDYALVISSDSGLTNALTLTNQVTLTNGTTLTVGSQPLPATILPLMTIMTNMFAGAPDVTGGFLLGQHAGANTPLLGTNTLAVTNTVSTMGPTAGQITVGMTNQWHFYVLTNDQSFTNAAFLTFLPPTLSLPRMGVRSVTLDNSTRPESDVDLYVSTNPGLTNLDPTVLAGAYKSLGRGGEETIVLNNAVPGAYYAAVKSESQEGAEFGFLGVFSLLPFDQNQDGNHLLRGFPAPQAIPDGTAEHPNGIYMFGVAVSPIKVHRAIVTNIISHELMSDLQGTLTHNRKYAVLNNHAPNQSVWRQPYIYDDSDEQNVTPLGTVTARHSDGPGSLQNFAGLDGVGQWMLTMVDNAKNHVGTNDMLWIYLQKQQDPADGITNYIQPGACVDDFIDVPPAATNLTVTITILGPDAEGNGPGAGPVSMTVCPQSGGGCQGTTVTGINSTSKVTIDKSSDPPLNAGTYVIHQCNNGTGVVRVFIKATILLGPPPVPTLFASAGPMPILDDAVTNSVINVNETNKVVTVEVGVRIDHPRVSDLVLHLIDPHGTRILLDENRGGTTTNGMGATEIITNLAPLTFSGVGTQTNSVTTGTNQGTIKISYNFGSNTNQMTVYYDFGLPSETTNWNSGMITGSGGTNLSYGPGLSNVITIIMNQGNPDPAAAWSYTVSSVGTNYHYFTFTENTNITVTPIKFAAPPFIPTTNWTTNLISDFEVPTGVYSTFTNTNGVIVTTNVDGWTVAANSVTVTGVSANTGVNSLALQGGDIVRTLPTVGGHTYTVSYAYRLAPVATMPGLVAWWKGEGNGYDATSNHNDLALFPSGTGYVTAEVGQGITVDGVNGVGIAPASPSLAVQSLTIEGWIYPSNTDYSPLVEYGINGQQAGPHLWINGSGLDQSTGMLFGNIRNPDCEVVSGPGLVPLNQWSHVALTYDSATQTAVLYWNGQVINSNHPTTSLGLPPTGKPVNLGMRPSGSSEAMGGRRFAGGLDEISIFNRALSAAEIQSIFAVGPAGKCGLAVPPPVCPMTNTASAQIVLNGLNYGVVTTTTTNWQTNTISFIATQAGTPLEVDSLGGSPGLLLDTFTLIDKGGPYEVLPEQPMDVLVGTNALGPWQLEVWDNRVGATNPSPTLVSWQLSFIFQNTLPIPVGLRHGATQCGTVNAGQTQYFTVAVPGWAQFATNWLISADAPVNLLFNQTGKPTGTNGPGDFTLLANSTTGLVPLSAGTTPPLLPGATYYLGIQNTNTNSVAYCLQVDFDVPALTLNVPVTSCLAAGPLPQYFSYDVTTNETGVEFQLLNLTGNADLVISTNPFPTLANNDYQSVNPGTNNEQITVLTNSAPVPLSPGRWYVGVFNSDVTPVCCTVLVTDLTNTLSGVITLTNGVPYAAVNPGSSNPAYDYYRYVVSTSAVRAQFEINGPTANVDLVAHQGLPLPDLTTNQFSSINSGASDQLITVFNSSSPVALAPGEWFLTAVNASGSPASYSIKASDWPLSGTNISLMSAPVSSANGFCFSWASLPGAHYYIQAKVNLTDAVWVTIQPVVTATNVTTTWCISLPSPYHFFRVEEEFVPLSGVASPVGDFTLGRSVGVMRLQWIALANKKFQVQWTPTLSPSNWKPLGSVTSSAGGLVSVTDDGSQTGGLGPMRFYRIQVVP